MYDVDIKSYHPIPSDLDKQNGYMTRYFVSKANQISSIVYEVSPRQYDDLIWRDYIVGVYFNWLIKGHLDNYTIKVYTGVPFDNGVETIMIPGVKYQNEAIIQYYSEKIPILKNTVRIYDQFYIGR